MIKYSILIPTCNKDLTKKCLEYIAELEKPQSEFEVLVIHNANHDNIESTVNSFKSKIANLRYMFEEINGLMASRHRGAREAQGEILCFLDDDSFVDKQYLIGIEEIFNDENVVFATGDNIPLYEKKPPKWIKFFCNINSFGTILNELSVNKIYKNINKIPLNFVYGCNMAVRKNVFFEVGGTNPDCMPPGELFYTGDGETSLANRLHNAGYTYAGYSPKIRIQHLVTAKRMTKEYFIKRYTYQGICNSFTFLREKNGIFINKPFTEIRKINKSIENPYIFVHLEKRITKIKKIFDKIIHLKSFLEYKKIKKECFAAYFESFNKHSNLFETDERLRSWILKENYLD